MNIITGLAQTRREELQLRRDLVDALTQAQSTFYIALQHYARLIRAEAGDEARLFLKAQLDERYQESRVECSRLERRLAAYFKDDVPRQLWHAIVDVLTARYWGVMREAQKPSSPVATPSSGRARTWRAIVGLTARHSGASKEATPTASIPQQASDDEWGKPPDKTLDDNWGTRHSGLSRWQLSHWEGPGTGRAPVCISSISSTSSRAGS